MALPAEAQTWLDLYVSELGHSPQNPGQLRSFVSNRRGHMSYSEARSILDVAQSQDELLGRETLQADADPDSWLQRFQTEMSHSPTASQLMTFARNRGGQISFAEARALLGSESQVQSQASNEPPVPPSFVPQRPIRAPAARAAKQVQVKLTLVKAWMGCEDCSICLDTGGDRWYRLRCQHAFHCDCIMDWLQRGNPVCPLCRQEAGDEVDIGNDRSEPQQDALQDLIDEISSASSATREVSTSEVASSPVTEVPDGSRDVENASLDSIWQDPMNVVFLAYAGMLAAGAINFFARGTTEQRSAQESPPPDQETEDALSTELPQGWDSNSEAEDLDDRVRSFVNGLASELRRRSHSWDDERIRFEVNRILSSLPEAHFVNAMAVDVHALVRRRLLPGT